MRQNSIRKNKWEAKRPTSAKYKKTVLMTWDQVDLWKAGDLAVHAVAPSSVLWSKVRLQGCFIPAGSET